MKGFENFEVWFVTGAQLLYGGDAVIAVDAHSNEMVKGLNESGNLPVKIVYKGTVNSAREVTDTLKAANNDPHCIGVITWMHTFSPAKMWIHGFGRSSANRSCTSIRSSTKRFPGRRWIWIS